MTPADRKYTRTHEWVKLDGEVATVGITDHAQDALGDITFVELPVVNSSLNKKKECGVIESVKAASDLYSPLSGTVSEVNEDLETTPEDINNDPYEKGWVFRLKGINPSELEELMDSSAYEKFLETEE